MSAPASELVLIFDFGSQFGQLIARRVREQNVFCQIVRHDLTAETCTGAASPIATALLPH